MAVVIHRAWAMPNKWTFKVPVIAEFVHSYVGSGMGWADPFAGQSDLAEWRNDLNPECNQMACMEALDFLEALNGTEIAGVIFDSPYSLTQVSRSYKDIGLKFKGKENPTGGFPKVRDAIAKILHPGGHVLSFGWNTVGMGIDRGFEMIELLVVCHGGNRNDTLCVAEVKK